MTLPPSFNDTIDAVEERVLALIHRHSQLLLSHAELQAHTRELEAEHNRLKSCLSAARQRIDGLITRLPPPGPTESKDAS